jgi:hypothetical protein
MSVDTLGHYWTELQLGDVSGDGTTHLEIGPWATTPLGRLLGWYNTTPKTLHDGRMFMMYAGYQYYLITKGNNVRFLKAVSQEELSVSGKYNWENVPGLETRLSSVLALNITHNPMILSLLRGYDLPIIWTPTTGKLRNSEKRWLRVVRNTVKRVRNDNLDS